MKGVSTFNYTKKGKSCFKSLIDFEQYECVVRVATWEQSMLKGSHSSRTGRESRTEITILFTSCTNHKHREQTKAHFITAVALALTRTHRFSTALSMVCQWKKENWEAFCTVMQRKCPWFIVLPRTPEGALCVSICKNKPYVNDLLTNLKAKSICYKLPVSPFFCSLCYCLNRNHHFRQCQV